MSEYLQFTIDKFTFRTATDRYYSAEGLWAKPEGNRVRIGLSDYLQQRSGDVAFVELKALGSVVRRDEELAVIETIKVNISLTSPVTGKVVEINPAMETRPEIINQDPYGEGWMMVVEVFDLKIDQGQWLDPQTYFDNARQDSASELNQP
ncbi:MAG: glycine cleavage system protein H [Acidobacteriaceae bacterium]